MPFQFAELRVLGYIGIHEAKRKVIALLVLFGIIAGAIALHSLLRQREPEYQGKTLSAWLKVGGHGDPDEDKPAIEAVRQIGTNAVPFLLDMVRAKDSKFKLKLTNWTYDHLHYDILWSSAYETHMRAEGGFGVLDPADAQRAVPTLMKLMDDPDYEVRLCAFLCLVSVKLDQPTKRQVLVKATAFYPKAAKYLEDFDQREAAAKPEVK